MGKKERVGEWAGPVPSLFKQSLSSCPLQQHRGWCRASLQRLQAVLLGGERDSEEQLRINIRHFAWGLKLCICCIIITIIEFASSQRMQGYL